MIVADTRHAITSCFGRLADALTRDVLPRRSFSATENRTHALPQYKEDGFFAFHDLPSSPAPYTFSLSAPGYASRAVSMALPGPTPAELEYPGEDEIHLFVNFIDGAAGRIEFDNIAFLPVILVGALVTGPGGVTSTLAETIGGADLTFANLDSVAGLSVGNLIRIRRSRRILMHPDWTYRFVYPATTVYLTVLADTPAQSPLDGADLTLVEVGGNPVASQNVGGVQIFTVPLGTPNDHVLGTVHDTSKSSDGKGKCLFYFPADLAAADLVVQVSHPGYIVQTVAIPITAGEASYRTVLLAPA